MTILNDYFATLGFKPKEQQTYLALAEAGKTTASMLSKKTGIPRATVYTVLDVLNSKGVVSQDHSGGSTFYRLNNTSSLLRLIDREREALEHKKDTAMELIDLLDPYLKNTQYSIPKLQFFEGKGNIETMLYDYLPEWRESILSHDKTLWGYQDHTVVEEYRKWHELLWKTSGEGEKIFLFSNASDLEKELDHKFAHREVRQLPDDIRFSISIWLYGDYLIMLMTRQKPNYAFQIMDPSFQFFEQLIRLAATHEIPGVTAIHRNAGEAEAERLEFQVDDGTIILKRPPGQQDMFTLELDGKKPCDTVSFHYNRDPRPTFGNKFSRVSPYIWTGGDVFQRFEQIETALKDTIWKAVNPSRSSLKTVLARAASMFW